MRRSLGTFGILGISLALFIAPFASAQTLPEGTSQEQIDAALTDLSTVYGSPVVRIDQAKAICNQEQYFVECAEIGQKHDLFTEERAEQVDALLDELQGEAINELKQCSDVACLVEAATAIARRLSANNAALARTVELTPAKVGEKKAIVDTAKSLGVDFEACRTMDPEMAEVELLRGCARLARHENVEKYISEETRTKAEQTETTIALKESLARGDVACGDGTLEGCGNFCLAPSPEARAEGTSAIPPVCRQIAERFFGVEGVRELERSYETVQETYDALTRRAEAAVFATGDGRKLTDPVEIGRYLEAAGARGDIEVVRRGMDFLIAHKLVNAADRDFALTMVQKIRNRGTTIDFTECSTNPDACEDIVPDENKGQFAAMGEVERIMRGELANRGVTDPARCERDQAIGEACLSAARAALPEIERLAGQSVEVARMVKDLRQKIRFGEEGFAARTRATEEITTSGGFMVAGRQFRSMTELDAFCREQPNECLAEVARRGLISRDVATERYERAVETRYTPPITSDPLWTGPQVSTTQFNKEEALKQFAEWLDNPVGAPPVPSTRDAYRYSPYPDPYRGPVCALYYSPCQTGYYRQELPNSSPSCPILGACIPLNTETRPPPVDERFICPAMPTVDSCRAGEEKVIAYSSPECGTYYSCKRVEEPEFGLTFPVTLSNGKAVLSLEEARSYCTKYGQADVMDECQAKFGVIYEDLPVPELQDCRQWGTDWINSSDDSGTCFNGTRTEYRTPGGTLQACTSAPVYGCATKTETSCSGDQYWDGIKCVVRDAYKGDGNSCPGFAFSRWDSTGTRYCQLNREVSCSYGYPAYMSDANYRAKYCPVGSTEKTVSGSCSSELIALLGDGCHSRSTAWFSGDLTKYILPNTMVVRQCTVEPLSGCYSTQQPTCAANEFWGGSACVSSSTSTSTMPAGQRQQVWNSYGLQSWVRTDADTARIGSLKQACANVRGSSANIWMPNAGTYSSSDFGMPDPGKCAKAAACTTSQYFDGATCTDTSTTVSGSCSTTILGLLGEGCHSMGNAWFNSGMTRYVLPGSSTVTECTTSYISGCTAWSNTESCPAGQYWNSSARVCETSIADGGSGTMQRCFYPNAARNGSPVGYTVWCAADYVDCHEGTPSGASVSMSGLSLGAPSSCESGLTGGGTSCPSGQYWSGSACVDSTGAGTGTTDCTQYGSGWHTMDSSGNCFDSAMQNYKTTNGTLYSCASTPTFGCSTPSQSCPSGQYWNGTSCVTTSPTDCPSGQYWNGSSCMTTSTDYSAQQLACTTAGGTWDSSSNYCNMPSSYTSGSDGYTSGSYDYSSAQSGCTSAGGTWDSSSNYCNMPSSTVSSALCPSGSAWTGSYCTSAPTGPASLLANVLSAIRALLGLN